MNLNFIIGIGRSGTNLLTLLLKNQEGTDTLSDIPFITFFYKSIAPGGKISEKNKELLKTYFTHYTNNQSQNIDRIQKLNSLESCDSYAALSKNIFKLISQNTVEPKFIFNKEPSYTLHVDLLVKLFPEAKFIYMVRDPRANYLSRKESINNRTTNIYYNCYRWNLLNKKGIDSINKYAEKIIIVRYEDLVYQPELEMKRIANFFGFELNKSTFREQIEQDENDLISNYVNPQFYLSHKQKLEKQINTDRINSWENSLSKNEIAICDRICSQTASFFGYKQKTFNITTKKKSHIQYLKAKYDYCKEFILLYISPAWKIKRINQIQLMKNKSDKKYD